MTASPLYQICGQFPQEERDRLRIRLDGVEFSYGSDEYVRHQNAKVVEVRLYDDYANRTKIVIAYTTEQKPKPEKEQEYKPEEPRYGNIGI